MDSATEVYTKRVNGAPCGDSVIQLFKGADSADKQEIRETAIRYIKIQLRREKQLVLSQWQVLAFEEAVGAFEILLNHHE